MKLSEKILRNLDEIKKHLYCGFASWDSLLDKIKSQEANPSDDYKNEEVWTFIIACGYAITGKIGIEKLCCLLTGKIELTSEKIWLEVLPLSPRENEGATHLDLAIGDITIRKGTASGIELKDTENSWIAFCEMKWYSDISYNVTNNQQRNQLARVIENALLFKNKNKYTQKVFVNLITPSIFKNSDNKSRMYCYKFQEYDESSKALESDINNCKLDYRKPDDQNNIDKRIPVLELNWKTFESLFESLPESDISNEIKEFEKKYNKAK